MPAGLPCGRPGMGDEIEGAVQQAAQPGRQFMGFWRLRGPTIVAVRIRGLAQVRSSVNIRRLEMSCGQRGPEKGRSQYNGRLHKKVADRCFIPKNLT